ncbi:hypothetical protein [Mucilaginibacter sp. NFX135]|uniref:hypothetical protein n=1 Tax=Mucilaginibacter sp. NFX135 TaxID=3402687 RepID=UPI003AFB049F
MNQYRSFDLLKTNELSVIRHGFFRPWFELTDGVNLLLIKQTRTTLLKLTDFALMRGTWR